MITDDLRSYCISNQRPTREVSHLDGLRWWAEQNCGILWLRRICPCLTTRPFGDSVGEFFVVMCKKYGSLRSNARAHSKA